MKDKFGFTLIELLVSLSIIGLLTAILYANFEQAREQSRDKTRLAALKELQLAIEQYRAQNGRYPLANNNAAQCNTPAITDFVGPGTANLSGLKGCSSDSAAQYIMGLVPDYIATLPTDPKFEFTANKGFFYRTDATGSAYKLMLYDVVEELTVTDFSHEYARCPSATGFCIGGAPSTTYAVYSIGAEGW